MRRRSAPSSTDSPALESLLRTDGQPTLCEAAEAAVAKLSQARRTLLQTRGILALRVAAPPRPEQDTFEWLQAPPEDDQQVTWYIDGSAQAGRWRGLQTLGFGIVGISRNGAPVACGRGVPPAWVHNAAGVEAWALAVVLRAQPGADRIVTDCLGLLNTAKTGPTKALGPASQLARTWRHIAVAMDGDLSRLYTHRVLVWMPAHKAVSAVGEALRSDGKRLSYIDWRANRLADWLAKSAAQRGALSRRSAACIRSAEEIVTHSAELLGAVTWYANNCRVVETNEDGKEVVKTLRDATPSPAGVRAARDGTKKRAAVGTKRASSSQENLPTAARATAKQCTKHAAAARKLRYKKNAARNREEHAEEAFQHVLRSRVRRAAALAGVAAGVCEEGGNAALPYQRKPTEQVRIDATALASTAAQSAAAAGVTCLHGSEPERTTSQATDGRSSFASVVVVHGEAPARARPQRVAYSAANASNVGAARAIRRLIGRW